MHNYAQRAFFSMGSVRKKKRKKKYLVIKLNILVRITELKMHWLIHWHLCLYRCDNVIILLSAVIS